LDPGGYFTLDSILIPYQEGPVDITVRISYTDDFNQPREIEQNLKVDVMPAMEMPTLEPGVNPEGVDFGPPETFFHKVMRFFRGLFGLDSAPLQPPTPMETTPEQPMPVPGPGYGGKGG
jgi:hypothetical protein